MGVDVWRKGFRSSSSHSPAFHQRLHLFNKTISSKLFDVVSVMRRTLFLYCYMLVEKVRSRICLNPGDEEEGHRS